MSELVTTMRREAAYRSRTNSQDFSDFQDDVIADLHRIADRALSNESGIASALQILIAETRAARERIEQLEARFGLQTLIYSQTQAASLYLQDWRSTKDVSWAALAEPRRMRVDPVYGQSILPFNDVVDRFYYKDFNTGEIVTDPGISITVEGTEETGASKVVAGTPTNAFNGVNESYWVREVLYEPKIDIEAVECTLTTSVPITRIMTSNVLVIHPYPVGLVDITGIWYSLDDTEPAYLLGTDHLVYPEVTYPIRNAGFLRFVLPPLDITKIKVGLRQRNFTDRNGWKSFQYGLQELALRFVDFDKTSDSPESNPNPESNNGVITVVECPTDYVFSRMTGFWASPTFTTLTDISQWPTYYKVYTDLDLTNLVWSSYTDPLPQDSAIDVSAQRTNKLYVLATCSYDTTRSAPPVLDYFGLETTTEV